MRPEIVLEHYRIGTPGQPPVEIGRNGPAITYKGSDLKTGAPVAITVIPTGSVDPGERRNFEEQAQTATLLDHVNIAKTVAFGTSDDFFVFISEYPQGETVEDWVKANGPMPPDAVLRVALQVVAALGAASFHGLTHPAIQPANLVIVPGKTAEGGWPFVKLTHFALAGLKSAPGEPDPDISASDYASPEQLLQGKVDFRSEIYSLGATLCFLLTGVFYSAYPRSPQTRRFTRPLRTLISKTLEDDPADRPQDPVLFAEELRACLLAVERRQDLKRRFGIPFAPIVAKAPRVPRFRRRPRPTPLLAPIGKSAAPIERTAAPFAAASVSRRSRMRYAWAAVVLLLFVGVAAALFLPEDVVTSAFHRNKAASPARTVESIGVPIGVPENTATDVAQSNRSVTPAASPLTKAPAASPATTTIASVNTAEERKKPVEPAPAVEPVAVANADSEPPPIQQRREPARETAPAAAPNENSSPAAAGSAATAVAATGSSDDNVKAPEVASETTPAVASEKIAPSTPARAATPVTIAENTKVPEPAPPSEAPDEKSGSDSADRPPSHSDTNIADRTGSSEPEATAPVKRHVASNETESRSSAKKSVAQNKARSSHTSRVPRALPIGPEDEPAHSGEVHARVVGVTPAGNVILAMPNGERAIVSPQDAEQYSEKRAHRRPHRVIIERRMVYPPPEYAAPYQPFLPSD